MGGPLPRGRRGIKDPSQPWTLGTTRVTAKIDAALGTQWAVFATEGNSPRRVTAWMPKERAERVRDNYEEAAKGDYESHPHFEVRCP